MLSQLSEPPAELFELNPHSGRPHAVRWAAERKRARWGGSGRRCRTEGRKRSLPVMTQFRASFRPLPGLNFAERDAAISIVSPVFGLRP